MVVTGNLSKMKLSFLLELLLILIIIAFAASMPVKEDRENVRKLKRISNGINVKQNIGLTSSTPVSIVADDDDDDDDDDDLFDDLVDDDEDEDDSGLKKDPKGPGDQESEDSDDEDDLFGLADDEAEKDTPSDEEEEEFDGSELILFGEDIFQAVFDDDDEDTNKKKKPEILNNTVNALLVTAPPSTVPTVAPVKDQLSSTELKPSNLNQKLANKTEILTEVNSNKNEKLTTLKPAVQLYLQHTPALLELAQSTLSHDASTATAPAPNTAIKHEELQSSVTTSQQDTVSAMHPVQYSAQITEKPDLIYEDNDEEKFDEAETNVDDDLGENEELIVVPDDKNENDKPIEEIKNPEEAEEVELLEDDDKQPEEQKPDEEEIIKDPLPIADDSENIIPQNDKLTLGPGQIVSEQQQSEVAQQLISAQQTESIKKPNKEEDESIIGIVESIIFDEDEDESDSSKPVKTDTTTNNQDKNDETLEDEEDEDEDDESEDDEDEDDDEKDEVQKPSVTTTTTTTSTTSSPTPNEVNNTIKKKKKKQSSLLGALEESLGLSRIMQSEKIKKGKGKNKSKK